MFWSSLRRAQPLDSITSSPSRRYEVFRASMIDNQAEAITRCEIRKCVYSSGPHDPTNAARVWRRRSKHLQVCSVAHLASSESAHICSADWYIGDELGRAWSTTGPASLLSLSAVPQLREELSAQTWLKPGSRNAYLTRFCAIPVVEAARGASGIFHGDHEHATCARRSQPRMASFLACEATQSCYDRPWIFSPAQRVELHVANASASWSLMAIK